MATLVYLVGPKAVGKTWVGRLLRERLGVFHLDADPLILGLMAAGVEPLPRDGWRPWVEPAVRDALESHEIVAVEATGVFEEDYDMASNLEAAGQRVLRVWLTAPEDETMARLRTRAVPRIPASEEWAHTTYTCSRALAQTRLWDVVIDTSGPPRPEEIIASFRAIL